MNEGLRPLAIRWTIGDVSRRGFEALRLSIWGAWKLFGPAARYAVCVNTISLERARALTGDLPQPLLWHRATKAQLPAFLRRCLDGGMSEGVGWKFAPLRLFPDCYELALDNDCILWELPQAIRNWLEGPQSCLLAADVRPCFGQFGPLCGAEPRNSGIRGLPPDFDLAAALQRVLAEIPARLTSELDEQGLQVAALLRAAPAHVVTVDEVTICSPFPPHLPHLGCCGAHFVGLNARQLPWSLHDRPAVEYIRDHWRRWLPALAQQIGAPPILA